MPPHPNQEAVLKIVEGFLDERLFRGWRVDGLHHDYLSNSYDLVCSNGDVTVRVRLMSEWIDEALSGHDHFKRRRIKRALKTAFRIESPDENDAA